MKILNPTIEAQIPDFNLAERVDNLSNAVVGIISNGKQGTDPFFEIFSNFLKEKFDVKSVESLVKQNYSAPAEEEITSRITKWDVAITGIGD